MRCREGAGVEVRVGAVVPGRAMETLVCAKPGGLVAKLTAWGAVTAPAAYLSALDSKELQVYPAPCRSIAYLDCR